mmetsp:Transcript_14555/g.40146  ORF Transcript_14555/g.40146 Transcript_14555/m.40146 type:complete len:119 (+) Transcript_14555:533-889(+)
MPLSAFHSQCASDRTATRSARQDSCSRHFVGESSEKRSLANFVEDSHRFLAPSNLLKTPTSARPIRAPRKGNRTHANVARSTKKEERKADATDASSTSKTTAARQRWECETEHVARPK